MADPTVDAVTNSGRQTGSSYSWSHTCSGVNRILMVGIGGGDWNDEPYFPGVTGITYTKGGSPVGLTRLGYKQNGGYYCGVELWYMIAPDAGTYDINVSITAPSAQWFGGGISVKDAAQTSPFGTVASAAGICTSGPDTIAVASASGELVIDVVSTGGHLYSTAQTQRVLLDIDASNTSNNFGMSTAAGATTVNMGYTMYSGDIYELLGVSIRALGWDPQTNAPETIIVGRSQLAWR